MASLASGRFGRDDYSVTALSQPVYKAVAFFGDLSDDIKSAVMFMTEYIKMIYIYTLLFKGLRSFERCF